VSVDVRAEIFVDQPEWYASIESVDWQTPPPAAVGSKVTLVARFFGRRLQYTYELVEFVAGERLVMPTAPAKNGASSYKRPGPDPATPSPT
jgi:hypothetical protein